LLKAQEFTIILKKGYLFTRVKKQKKMIPPSWGHCLLRCQNDISKL